MLVADPIVLAIMMVVGVSTAAVATSEMVVSMSRQGSCGAMLDVADTVGLAVVVAVLLLFW